MIVAILSILFLLSIENVGAMIYKPSKGVMWDPSVLYHDGTYYAFMMYDKTGLGGLNAGHCLLATSRDGVHWKDEGVILKEYEEGCRFFKCFVAKCGDRFIMNHGVFRPTTGGNWHQDTLRFYESTDLKNWKYISSSKPDTRWYVRPGRWDHMYMLPKEDGNPEAGYWGYVVSVPKQGVNMPGMMQSSDGLKWEVLPPAGAEWGDTPSRNNLEYGGCERIGGKYYLIGGGAGYYMGNSGYSMFTMVGDGPRGPFRPDVEAFRLCGTSRHGGTWLAAWCRGKGGELLISDYANPCGDVRHPFLLPLRKAVVDGAGHLRLGWWKGNEALKGEPESLDKSKVKLDATGKPDGYALSYLDTTFNTGQGIVLEGKVKALSYGDNPAVGFVLEEGPDQSMSMLLGIGEPNERETHVGRLVRASDGTTVFTSMDVTGKGCATVTGIEPGRERTFRLLVRAGFFELYIDDLLVQTFNCPYCSGRLGFVVRDSSAELVDLLAWKMSLDVASGFKRRIRDKTLVAWAAPANVEQRGGSLLTIENPGSILDGLESPKWIFDGIGFGELAPGKWMAASEHFHRTQTRQDGSRVESTSPDRCVQIAVVYRGKSIAIYRNGEEYARYDVDNERAVFSELSTVLVGRRYTEADVSTCFAGKIDDARIYDTALSAEQIASLKPNKPSQPEPWARWDFEDGTPTDKTGHFGDGQLVGNARIVNGHLVLNGKGDYLIVDELRSDGGP